MRKNVGKIVQIDNVNLSIKWFYRRVLQTDQVIIKGYQSVILVLALILCCVVLTQGFWDSLKGL